MLDTTVATTTWAYKEVTNCRACGSKQLAEVFNAGDMSIVEFPKIGELPKKPKVPLCLLICEKCFLVQLRHSTNPTFLYEEFWYRSGTNEMMRAALKDVAKSAVEEVGALEVGDRILDIGCNDGTLLMCYPSGVDCVGIDPAKNIQVPGKQISGWYFINGYFSEDAVGEWGKFKVVTALAMFYDLDEPVKFCQEVKKVLHHDGIFIVQMNYLPTMLKNNGVDNICHEHLTYFSLHTLMPVFEEAGLTIYKAELNDVNGGSIRVYAKHESPTFLDGSVGNILQQEYNEGLHDLRGYSKFSKRVRENCVQLDAWLDFLCKNGRQLYAYGASTRGTTLLQLLNTKGKLVACAERDERKIGRYMVGAELPIVSEDEARKHADYLLVLPWHFLSAIKKREAAWLQHGGRMIVPFPTPVIHDWS